MPGRTTATSGSRATTAAPGRTSQAVSPPVHVHDLKIHPRGQKLIPATHGRGIWIVEISPLEQLSADVLAASAWLFEPKTAYEYGEPTRASFSAGQKYFRSPSPAYGAEIVYRLTTGSTDRRGPAEGGVTGRAGGAPRAGGGAAPPRRHPVAAGVPG